jgi:hypothetical protein
MKVGIILFGWGIGGSEKRFANLSQYLKEHGKFNYVLLTNRFLEQLLRQAGISLGSESLQFLLNSRWGRVFDRPDPNSRNIRI